MTITKTQTKMNQEMFEELKTELKNLIKKYKLEHVLLLASHTDGGGLSAIHLKDMGYKADRNISLIVDILRDLTDWEYNQNSSLN